MLVRLVQFSNIFLLMALSPVGSVTLEKRSYWKKYSGRLLTPARSGSESSAGSKTTDSIPCKAPGQP